MAMFDISSLFRAANGSADARWQERFAAQLPAGSADSAFNLLRTGDDAFRISLAVPGFTAAELTVESRDRSVTVDARRPVDPLHNQYIYRGFGAANFQRTFALPDYVRVAGASLENGVLHIDLVRELPEALRPRRIEIRSADAVPLAKSDGPRPSVPNAVEAA